MYRSKFFFSFCQKTALSWRGSSHAFKNAVSTDAESVLNQRQTSIYAYCNSALLRPSPYLTMEEFHSVPHKCFLLLSLPQMVFWKSNKKSEKKQNKLDNISTVQKSSTFHCLDPNCVRRCNKSSGFYLFTNRLWLYCCTVYFPFWRAGRAGRGGVHLKFLLRECVTLLECAWEYVVNVIPKVLLFFLLFWQKYNCEIRSPPVILELLPCTNIAE